MKHLDVVFVGLISVISVDECQKKKVTEVLMIFYRIFSSTTNRKSILILKFIENAVKTTLNVDSHVWSLT